MWSALIEIWIHIILFFVIVGVVGLFALFFTITGTPEFRAMIDEEEVPGHNEAHSHHEDQQ